MRIAAIQMHSGTDREANLARAAGLLAQAAAGGADLALLPENFALMAEHDRVRLERADAAHDSQAQAFLEAQARQLGMAIIGGGTLVRSATSGKLRNRCLAVDAQGRCIATYDKMHLFDAGLAHAGYHESALVEPGEAPCAVTLNDVRIGLSICYDLRFPELYRHYADAGCELLCVPAAFTVPTGRAHWEVLLRARAIENQCYVLAAGQWGEYVDGRHCWGHSMIIDPWGEILAELDTGEGVITAELHMERLAEVRHRLPALRHRRC